MIVITGWRSAIAVEFRKLLPADAELERGAPLEAPLRTDADRYLFCQGVIRPKTIFQQSDAERDETLLVNADSIIAACDEILAVNKSARICIIGSESAYRGSFDGAYWQSKRRIHEYVDTKDLPFPGQQLVAISPSIIDDTGMTNVRTDIDELEVRRHAHPKKRFLKPIEVAEVAKFLLFGPDYLTGTVIRMHGGLK